jgi:predicted XRE-type DNA-binding protein
MTKRAGKEATMRKTKRKRLTARGWRIGDAKDFLGLSAAEAALVELKLALSTSLRARRQAQRLTQAAVARRLNSSQSRVAKMEAGDRSVSLDLLVRSLAALGATPRDIARALIKRPQVAA